MPAYDYDCAACGRRFEVIHGVHADPPSACPLCGRGPVRKAITAPAVHYKGSGWAKKERRATVSPGTSKPAGEGTATPDGGAKSEGGSSDGGAKSEGGSSDGGAKSEGGSPEAATIAPAKAAEAGATSKTD